MLLSKENQEIYNKLCSKASPVFEMVMSDKRRSEEYRKGFTDGFHQVKMELISVLITPLSIFAKRSISAKGLFNLIDLVSETRARLMVLDEVLQLDDGPKIVVDKVLSDLDFIKEILIKDFE